MSLFNAPFENKTTEFYGITSEELNTNSLNVTSLDVDTITAESIEATNDITSNNGDIVAEIGSVVAEGDITSLNGNVTTEGGDIESTTGNVIANLNVEATEAIVTQSITSSSIGGILVSQGTHSWDASDPEGSNPLVIMGLNGDSDYLYNLYIAYNGQATNSNNHLIMRINSLSVSNYSSRITQNTSNLNDTSNNDQWVLINYNTASTKYGMGKFDIWASKSLSLDSPSMVGLYSSHEAGNNSSQNYKGAWSFDDPTANEVQTLRIDVNNANHDGWDIYYRLIRLR